MMKFRIMYVREYDTSEDKIAKLDLFGWVIHIPWVKPLPDPDPKLFSEAKWYGFSNHLFDRDMECFMIYYGGEAPVIWCAPWHLVHERWGEEDQHIDTTFYDKENDKTVSAKAKRKLQYFRYNWLRWLPWNIKRYRAEIDFSEEVGEDVGTWKGGTLSISCPMDKDEHVLDAVQRYEEKGL